MLLNQAVAWAYRIRLREDHGLSLLHSPQELIMMAGGVTAAAEALAEAYQVALLHPRSFLAGETSAQTWRLAICYLAGRHECLPKWPYPDYTGHVDSHQELIRQRRPAITAWFVRLILQRRQAALAPNSKADRQRAPLIGALFMFGLRFKRY